MKNNLSLILISAFIFLFSVNINAVEKSIISDLQNMGFEIPSAEAEATDIKLENLDGKEISLSSYKGKIVFLNFWATWCPPCRAEMPSMKTLNEKYRDKGFKMLAVNLRENKNDVQAFIKKNGYDFEVLLDKSGAAGYAYQVQAIPTTYIIDKNGYIIARLTGSIHWDNPEIYSIFDGLLE